MSEQITDKNIPAVEIQGLEKIYDGVTRTPALRGIDLVIEPGEFTAIAGPSGSGKTTLLNLIGGLDVPTSGLIRVGGRNLAECSQARLAELRLNNIGFIFQQYNLIPVLTVAENVEFTLNLMGDTPEERRRKVKDMLEALGIGEYHMRRPRDISGGQQQRVAIARAMVGEPLLVLADEPTANLDSQAGADLLELMRDLNHKRGTTFIFSTHDNMVMDYARRLIKLKDGLITEDKRTE